MSRVSLATWTTTADIAWHGMTFSACEIVLCLLHLLSLSFFSVFSFSFSLFFNAEYSRLIEFVARSRQVCIYVVEALLIACYLSG
jgi:hypothetical protein